MGAVLTRFFPQITLDKCSLQFGKVAMLACCLHVSSELSNSLARCWDNTENMLLNGNESLLAVDTKRLLFPHCLSQKNPCGQVCPLEFRY